MTNGLMFFEKVRSNAVFRQIVLGLIVTAALFVYSSNVPEYLKVAVKADLGGLVLILYTVWLSLFVLWFRAWQMIFHASTHSE
jgi:hypothetical protein